MPQCSVPSCVACELATCCLLEVSSFCEYVLRLSVLRSLDKDLGRILDVENVNIIVWLVGNLNTLDILKINFDTVQRGAT